MRPGRSRSVKIKQMKIMLVTRWLGQGGTERQVVLTANALAARGHDVLLAVFYSGGVLEADLDRKVRLISLGKSGRWDMPGFMARLRRLLRIERPDVINSYLAIPNLCVSLAALATRIPVVWGIRSSQMNFEQYDRTARLGYWLEAKLSRMADAIIANSALAARQLPQIGYWPDRIVTIANGIDCARFHYQPAKRDEWRRQLGIDPAVPLVGIVARLDPMKDHSTFLAAAATLVRRLPAVQFACIGDGPLAAQLRAIAQTHGLTGRIHWLGARMDVEEIYPALDLHVSTSAFGEGFCNALAEAMASEIPCVATNVGDAALILGDASRVIRAGDAVGMVDAWERILKMAPAQRRALGLAGRQRILDCFSVEVMVDKTLAVYKGLIRQ